MPRARPRTDVLRVIAVVAAKIGSVEIAVGDCVARRDRRITVAARSHVIAVRSVDRGQRSADAGAAKGAHSHADKGSPYADAAQRPDAENLGVGNGGTGQKQCPGPHQRFEHRSSANQRSRDVTSSIVTQQTAGGWPSEDWYYA